MPTPNDLPKDVLDLIQGDPWGKNVYPPRPNPPPLARDGRTAALRVFRSYLAALLFLRPGPVDARGARGEPIPFRVPKERIHIGWPDYEVDLEANFPSIVFLHQPGEDASLGLANYIDEKTQDKYGRGTVVQWMSEYQEDVIMEIWANKAAELRGLLAGIETASSPTELMAGLRFRIPDYYDQIVSFSSGTRQEFDEEDSARNRRRARLTFDMRFTKVALINAGFPLAVTTHTAVDVDPDTNREITAAEVRPRRDSPRDPCTADCGEDPCR